MISRRGFLVAGGALAVSACAPQSRQLFLSAATDRHGQHFAAAVDADGVVPFRVPIGFRGHDVIADPAAETAIVVARRPDVELVRFDLHSGEVLQQLTSEPGRHQYGHGVFTADGAWFLTTENDYDNARGVIVVRDAETLRVVGEMDSYGIGPHELRWLADDKTLAVANGGIRTHPDTGRDKLNLGSMAPSLVEIDFASGELLKKHVPDSAFTSIRHIDIVDGDRVVMGMQQENYAEADQPLVAITNAERKPLLPGLPDDELRAMSQYVASVCVDPETENAVATCPRGHRITFWNAGRCEYLGSFRLVDAAGVCVDQNSREFVVSTGRGYLHRFDTASLRHIAEKRVRTRDLRWDNHLIAV
ncbi:MAG: DUF1513 domain-containing protein [Pseudomonadota bacterium]